ncbi:MAG: hypothetical protein EZS28_009590 [Streblomastix strix]|uniref:Trichohyalin-plectin-homology domain-containing protein n=1 Tax=Streblomastix strix TaxID=222440 RepID=A0A5J4WIF5_9EUKA|nr:MAG: hypothetical protein EZS28_009590 [Streblomastix strix]
MSSQVFGPSITDYMAIRPHQKGYTPTHFETRTDVKLVSANMKRNIERLRHERQKDLERRRMLLANLYREDEQQYIREFAQVNETPQQRNEKRKQRAYDLRARREEEDRAKSQVIMDKKFGDESDLVKKKRTELDALQVASDQLLQINQKRENKAREQEKEKEWAAVWENERLKKLEEELRRADRAKMLDKEMVAKLDEQIDEIIQRKLADERLHFEEAQLAQEKEDLRKKKEEQEFLEKEREKGLNFCEYKRFNKILAQKAAREAAKQRDEDIKYIQSVLDREKREMDAEKAVKDEQRRELIMQRQLLLDEMRAIKEDDKEIDRLIAIEGEKEYQKRAAVWKKEQDARDKLLREVIADREAMIKRRIQEKIDAMEDNYAEAERIAEQVRIATQKEEEDAAAIRKKNIVIAGFQQVQRTEKKQREKLGSEKEQALEERDRQYNKVRADAEERQAEELEEEGNAMRLYVRNLAMDLNQQPLSQPKARQMQLREDIEQAKREQDKLAYGIGASRRGNSPQQKAGTIKKTTLW